MKNKYKLFITAFLSIIITILFSIKSYAWTTEEMINAKRKYEYGTYYFLDNIYKTANMDASKCFNLYSKYMTWDGGCPYNDESVYVEVSQSGLLYTFVPHLGTQNSYSRMIKPKIIDSYDNNAEYMICYSNYDQILIIIDGDTFKGDIGLIVNDFFLKQKGITHEFYMPYSDAAKSGGVLSISRYEENNTLYMAECAFQVGFNLALKKEQPKDSDNPTNPTEPEQPVEPITTDEPAEIKDPVDDPAIYGGNEDVKIDDTPTKKEEVKENNALKTVGIASASVLSILGLYLIYVLIKKIYQTMKG